MTAYFPEVERQIAFYSALVRDEKAKLVCSCFHFHRTQGAAQKCAEKLTRSCEVADRRGTE